MLPELVGLLALRAQAGKDVRMFALRELLIYPGPRSTRPANAGRALAAIYFDLSVDDHKVDPHRVLIRLFESRAIDYRPG